MTLNGWLQILIFLAVVFALTKPLGTYLFSVFEGPKRPLPRIFGPLERFFFKVCGINPDEEQGWKEYAASLIMFSVISMLITYAILRFQNLLPLNPQKFGPVPAWLAMNTSISFTTNTNWQAYSGETTMSYFSQMAGLAWHNFTSAAAGIGVALAIARGFTRKIKPGMPSTIGNFWADLIRGTIYVLLPISFIAAIFLVSQGVIQNFSAYHEIMTIEGSSQIIAMGPVASQEAIKELGTNGGGFFNANSAHPFENPTPLSNMFEMILIFAIPSALTYTYGRMAKSQKDGWIIWAAMAILFTAGVATTYWAESHPNAAVAGINMGVQSGNMEGKETRFGITGSSLFATVTTDASCGAVNSMHDSFNPIGGLVPMLNIQLGEVIFGGVGAGLYGMLMFVILTVFIAGLMVGRTPEYLGKKIEANEMKFVMLYVLIFPIIILGFTAWGAVAPYGVSSLNNSGPHGLSEILYAFTSAAGNNGSAFAGLNANTDWYNITLGLSMLFGRFFMIIPVLAIAGSMAAKKTVPAGPGTFHTDGGMFLVLLLSVIIIVGALTFFPALTLGPIVEHFAAVTGTTF
ncbi:potassium-transporting ATPase subunit KdpA [Desulforegula conservatrix]|uniref:potassium-transporting ATPase subunit KdpA n=1 Tax=Desulforegula conservatrix TaxID=153026 RepID=UPI00042174D2|nr:potassium-transporting ATPase subunit KdpA [Desulforegula conservatrix]